MEPTRPIVRAMDIGSRNASPAEAQAPGLAVCGTVNILSDVRMDRMASAAHGGLAALIFVVTMAGLVMVPVTAQSPIDVYELADYRLTTEVFERFVQANGRIVDITLHDASFTFAPLFTKDVALSGDAVAEAAGLMARLANHAALAAALEAAKITPREYQSSRFR